MRASSNLDRTAQLPPRTRPADEQKCAHATNICFERAFDGPLDERPGPFNLDAHLDRCEAHRSHVRDASTTSHSRRYGSSPDDAAPFRAPLDLGRRAAIRTADGRLVRAAPSASGRMLSSELRMRRKLRAFMRPLGPGRSRRRPWMILTTESTAMPLVAPSTNVRRCATFPPIASSRCNVSGRRRQSDGRFDGGALEIRARRASLLLRDLKQVADDHLVVQRFRDARLSPLPQRAGSAEAVCACCDASAAIAALASPTHKCAARPAALPPSPFEDDGSSLTISRRSNVSGCRRRCGQSGNCPEAQGRVAPFRRPAPRPGCATRTRSHRLRCQAGC